MRAPLFIVLSAVACTKPVPHIDPPDAGDPHGGDAGEQTSGCAKDEDCGASQVCVNCSGVGECAPGCRENSQCAAREICQLGTVCQSCPCPPGWCVLDPCRDEDNDGYVPGDDATVTCPGKQKGDCNDRAPDIHPGAPELCQNYRDDNCDGKYDERDPQCVCPGGEQRCSNTWECGGAGSVACTKGCCEACPDPGQKPSCNFGGGTYCAQHYGSNPYTGCTYGWSCDTCSSCPTTVDPVCGANGSSYDNSCLLNLRYTKQVHHGACLPGEGIYCELPGNNTFDGGCGPSGDYYCRRACPSASSCGYSQCTMKGACVLDSDCPAGLPAPPPADCDGGTPALRCVNSACVSRCG